jgi:prevent-host-death family protein
MIDVTEIHSLTDFQRNAKEHIERLSQTGKPQVLTINGKAAIVVQDAASYQRLLDDMERLEATIGIMQGIDDMKSGKGRPANAFFDELQRKYDIPDDE